MTHFGDMAPCDYFGAGHSSSLLAVGWLTSAEKFETGQVKSDTFAKLKTLLLDPWQPMMQVGIHECELCQFDKPAGHKNLFVPNGSIMFVCSELIVHYIAAHHYRPPDEFIEALAACPDTRSMDFKKLFLASGG